jgi:RND family efflux transporter MFP subunit
MNLAMRRKLLSSLMLVSLLSVSCSRTDQAPPGAGGPGAALSVKAQELQSNSVEESSDFVGTLAADQRVTLQPQTQGRIEQVFVKNGDRVTQGTPIAALSIDQSKANVATEQAGVSSAQAASATSQAQLQTAQANRTKAAADLQLQQTQFNRTRTLVSEGAQSQQQLDIAQRDLDAASATLAAADKQVKAAEAAVRQAEAVVNQAQARVASANVDVNFRQVTAPMTGIVGDFPVRVGDYVTPQTTITTITSNDALDMQISVPSNYTNQLRVGLPVQLLDPNTKKSLGAGSINFISPRVDAGAQSILTKARFTNSGNLRDGQYVQAKIVWNRSSGILVPTTAITRIGGQAFVFVVDQKPDAAGKPAQVASQRPVKLGTIQGDNFVVLDGLKAGDKIVTSNILRLRDGAPIQLET